MLNNKHCQQTNQRKIHPRSPKTLPSSFCKELTKGEKELKIYFMNSGACSEINILAFLLQKEGLKV